MNKVSVLFLKGNFFYISISLFTILFVVCGEIDIQPDSDGYLKMDIIRSCGYPFFTSFHKMIFGIHYLNAIVFSQLILLLYAAYFFSVNICADLMVNKYITGFTFFLLLVPAFYDIKIVNAILSEGLAYPLYLIVITFFLKALLQKQFKNYYFAFFFTYVLLLVRSQFIFLLLVFLICIILSEKKFLITKKSIFRILTILSIPIFVIFTDILFHKIKHNSAVKTPWTGIQIATLPFFVSDEDDYLLFEEKPQQEYFKFIYSALKEKKLLQNQISQKEDPIETYYNNYILISNETISDKGNTFFDTTFSRQKKIILNDKITISMTLPLIKHNFVKWIKLYFKNCTKGIGTFKNLLLSIVLLLGSATVLLKRNSKLLEFIVFCNLLLIGNVMVVALAEPATARYMFYNNWIMLIVVCCLFQKAILNKSND